MLGDIDEVFPTEKELMIEVGTYLECLSTRRSQIIEVFDNPKNIDKVQPLSQSPVTKLISVAEKLEFQAKAYEKTKESEERGLNLSWMNLRPAKNSQRT